MKWSLQRDDSEDQRYLSKVTGNFQLMYEELLITIVKVELTLNSRPLKYLSPDDVDEPLTPTYLLSGLRILNLYVPDLPAGKEDEYLPDTTQDDLIQRMKHFNKI